jgi:hypothetical protein
VLQEVYFASMEIVDTLTLFESLKVEQIPPPAVDIVIVVCSEDSGIR